MFANFSQTMSCKDRTSTAQIFAPHQIISTIQTHHLDITTTMPVNYLDSSSSSSSSVAKWHMYHSKKNFITNTHYYMWLNKFQTWKNFSHQQAYHILSTESSTNPIYKGLRFDMYLTGGHCSTARLVFWLGSGRIQSTCIDSTVCWFCYPCVNRVARHISTLL